MLRTVLLQAQLWHLSAMAKPKRAPPTTRLSRSVSRLLKLPEKIRKLIYLFTLIPRTKGNTAILTLNRRVSNEALSVLYANNVFDCTIFGWSDLNRRSSQASYVWGLDGPASPTPLKAHMGLVTKLSFHVNFPDSITSLANLLHTVAQIHGSIAEVCNLLTNVCEVRICYSNTWYPDEAEGTTEEEYLLMSQQALQGFKRLRGISKLVIDAPKVQPELIAKLRQAMTTPKPIFPFFKLPAELRNEIYHMVFSRNGRGTRNVTNVLTVNKQIHAEANSISQFILYSSETFYCRLGSRSDSRPKDNKGNYLLIDIPGFKFGNWHRAPASSLRYIESIKLDITVGGVGNSRNRAGKVGRFKADVARAKERLLDICSSLTSLREIEVHFSNLTYEDEKRHSFSRANYVSMGQQALEPLKKLGNLKQVRVYDGRSQHDHLHPEYKQELIQAMMETKPKVLGHDVTG